MKAPEHYKEAMRLLSGHPGPIGEPAIGYGPTAQDVAMAQVHATLALATAIGEMLTDFAEHMAEHHQDGSS